MTRMELIEIRYIFCTIDFFRNLGETSYERIFLQIKEW